MKLLQKSILIYMLLGVAFSFGGCSWLGLSESSNKKDKPVKSLEQLKVERDAKSKEIDETLEKDSKEKKEKADATQKECDDLKKNHKPPLKDKDDLPDDIKPKCNQATSLKTSAKQAFDDLEKAKKDKEGINKLIEDAENEEKGGSGLMAWIFPVLIGFLSLLVIAGLVTLVLLFRSSWQKFRAETDSRLIGLENKARQLSEENRQLKKTVEVLSNQIVEQKKSFNNLAQRLSERTQNSAPQPINYAPPPPREEPIFPISSENYQNRFGANASSATVDPLTGFLIEDAGKGDEFLLIRDNGLSGEQRYVVPNIRRFSTKNDYLNYYQNFYACENPSGGTVWIKSPTVVRRVSDGWKLQVMGELEIRM